MNVYDQALDKRGILPQTQKYGWEVKLIRVPRTEGLHDFWRYTVTDPLTGVTATRWKRCPGVPDEVRKYSWGDGEPRTSPNGQKYLYVWSKGDGKPDDLHYYAPQGKDALMKAIEEAGGVLNIVNGEPAVLAMLAAGIKNVLCWFGESSVPHTFADDMPRLGAWSVVMWPDNDGPGKGAADKVRGICQRNGIPFEARHHGIDKDKADINDAWIADGFNTHAFRRRLADAKPADLPEVRIRPQYERAAYEGGEGWERLKDDVRRHIEARADKVLRVNSRGWLNHSSLLREEEHPSAGFNINTGAYHDFAHGTIKLREYAAMLGFRVEDYLPAKDPRRERPMSEQLKGANLKAAPKAPIEQPAQDATPPPSQDEPQQADDKPTEPPAFFDYEWDDTFWYRPGWQMEHRLFSIGGPRYGAQMIARFRRVYEQGGIGRVFTNAEIADAIGVKRSKIKPYLEAYKDVVWTQEGKSAWVVMQKPDLEELKRRHVMPALYRRHIKNSFAPNLQTLLQSVKLSEDAIEYHTIQADAYKLIRGEYTENRAFVQAVKTLDTPIANYPMPDPWLDHRIYKGAVLRAIVQDYYASHETRIEASLEKRAANHEERVEGASNRYLANASGLNIDSVRNLTKRMGELGIVERHFNQAYVKFDRTDAWMSASREKMARQIMALPAEYYGRLISVTCEGPKGHSRHTLTGGLYPAALDDIMSADKVSFRIDQGAVCHPGWEGIEALFGSEPKEVDDAKAEMDEAVEAEQAAQDIPPAQEADGPKWRKAWSKAAEKRVKQQLKADGLEAYGADWVMNQLLIGYKSATDLSIKAAYAAVLGIEVTDIQPQPLDDIPF